MTAQVSTPVLADPRELALPAYERPFEVQIAGGR